MMQGFKNNHFVIPSNVEGSLHFGRDYRAAKKQNGFTLVELAIALMVIGLLIGGVLKGQELIENARITRVIKDINDYDTAVMIFRNTYNGLPGDLRRPNRIPNCGDTPAAFPCNHVSTRTGSGTITSEIEEVNFWRHLERAGLISGINEEGTNYNVSPVNAFGGHYIIRWVTPVTPAAATASHPQKHYYRIGSGASDGTPSANADYISVARIMALDQKMDDGKPMSGRVQIYHTQTEMCHDTATQEYVTDQSQRCYLLIESPSAN